MQPWHSQYEIQVHSDGGLWAGEKTRDLGWRCASLMSQEHHSHESMPRYLHGVRDAGGGNCFLLVVVPARDWRSGWSRSACDSPHLVDVSMREAGKPVTIAHSPVMYFD
jgi:hypothetical protein